MKQNNSSSLKVWLEKKGSYIAIKLVCGNKTPNIGAISSDKFLFYLNVRKGFPRPYLNVIVSDSRFQLSPNGRVKKYSGSGYIGFIDFENLNAIISYLKGIGLEVDCCPSAVNGSLQVPTGAGQLIPRGGPSHGQCINFIALIQSWTHRANVPNFQDLYNHIINEMGALKRHVSINSPKVKCLKWPKLLGVYVVKRKHQTPNCCEEIVYVGMTGKFNKFGKLPQHVGLAQGVHRVFPYRFTITNGNSDFFEFSPNASSYDEWSKLNPNAQYGSRIKLADLSIDCFTVDQQGLDAPAFLEAVILQSYLLSYKKLPEANNAF